MNHSQSQRNRCRVSSQQRWAHALGAILAAAFVLPVCGDPEEGGSAVLTSRNDNYRTGAQISEKKLRPNKINVNNFGHKFTRQVDGKIYAQLLYVPKVRTADGHKHDIVYASTAHNTVLAFDANDESRTEPLWSRNLGPSVPNTDTAIPTRSCNNMTPEIGIVGTPTIDGKRETMYLVAKIKENGLWFNRLFALDIATGDLRRPPVDIEGSVPGTGDTSVNGVLTFEGRRHNQRPGLLLLKRVLYIAFAAHCDVPPTTAGFSPTTPKPSNERRSGARHPMVNRPASGSPVSVSPPTTRAGSTSRLARGSILPTWAGSRTGSAKRSASSSSKTTPWC